MSKVFCPGFDTLAAGPGGNWDVIEEELCHSEVVKQINPDSCVAACGEMLSDGALDQADLIERIGAPAALESLVAELGGRWRAGYANQEGIIKLLAMNKTFGTTLKTYNARAHAVVVDGPSLSETIKIRDPWHPSKYQMTNEEFGRTNTRIVVFRV